LPCRTCGGASPLLLSDPVAGETEPYVGRDEMNDALPDCSNREAETQNMYHQFVAAISVAWSYSGYYGSLLLPPHRDVACSCTLCSRVQIPVTPTFFPSWLCLAPSFCFRFCCSLSSPSTLGRPQHVLAPSLPSVSRSRSGEKEGSSFKTPPSPLPTRLSRVGRSLRPH
jgi:hypothetical protein